jgi:hypothetical protein
MEHRGLVLGPAHTRFNDYVGTVAADDAEVVKDQPSLYELADVDRDRYTILAVDLSIDGPVTATVYAIDRVEHGITRHSELAELSASRRQIPVLARRRPGHVGTWARELRADHGRQRWQPTR